MITGNSVGAGFSFVALCRLANLPLPAVFAAAIQWPVLSASRGFIGWGAPFWLAACGAMGRRHDAYVSVLIRDIASSLSRLERQMVTISYLGSSRVKSESCWIFWFGPRPLIEFVLHSRELTQHRQPNPEQMSVPIALRKDFADPVIAYCVAERFRRSGHTVACATRCS